MHAVFLLHIKGFARGVAFFLLAHTISCVFCARLREIVGGRGNSSFLRYLGQPQIKGLS